MIKIERCGLDVDLAKQLDPLSLQLAAASPAEQGKEAKRMWDSRRAVHRRLTALLRDMAPGVERCMYCGDSQGLGDRSLRADVDDSAADVRLAE
jgi:hypothetical protein